MRFSERGAVEVGDRDAVSITQMFEHFYCIWWMDIAYWKNRGETRRTGLAKRTIAVPFYVF